MPGVALTDCLQLCRIPGCLYTIRSRSTYFHGFGINGSRHHNFSYDIVDNLFM
jgi:hypothetical protein